MHFRKLIKCSSYLFLLFAVSVGPACGGSEPETRDHGPKPLYAISAEAVNINTADAGELTRIPHVGPALAAKIVEHRQRHGAFRKTEHLMLIDGFSDKRFRQIRHLIKTE